MMIISQHREQLGSVIEIKLPEEHKSLFEECFAEIHRIEEAYSRFLDTSELSRVNRNLGQWQAVSEEFLHLVLRGLEFHEKTEGSFDITLKADLDRLGYDKEYSFTPRKHKVSLKQRLFSFLAPICIDKGRILLRREIEFGGLGKGYALDRVAALLDKANVQKYYVNAGGDIIVRGSWEVLLEHPDDTERVIGKIMLKDRAIAGSAPNRRKWRGHHHLLNARTRLPEHSTLCVFVIAKTGIEADAYATSIFAAGFEKGMKLTAKLPVDALIVSADRKMFLSDGFTAELYR